MYMYGCNGYLANAPCAQWLSYFIEPRFLRRLVFEVHVEEGPGGMYLVTALCEMTKALHSCIHAHTHQGSNCPPASSKC